MENQNLPCKGCKGLCCGPVPITKQELKKIRAEVRLMPAKTRLHLESQLRFFGTCIFYDLDNDRCGIRSVRPSICRAFGLYQNLVCFRNPGAAAPKDFVAAEDPVGTLSIDYTWKDFK
ncbi:MAG: YkgJ family cysteine cluster protein [Bacillota bacterium]